LIYELFTIPLANARGSDSLTRGSDLLPCLVSEPRALASGIVNKPQVKHACRKDTFNPFYTDKVGDFFYPHGISHLPGEIFDFIETIDMPGYLTAINGIGIKNHVDILFVRFYLCDSKTLLINN
jgi:hypothetical protein